MDLWIRSQDKSCLVNVKAVIMLNKEIRGYYNENPNWFLGKYNNEERALEVLDEIQNILKHEWDYKDKFSMCRIYEMPKE